VTQKLGKSLERGLALDLVIVYDRLDYLELIHRPEKILTMIRIARHLDIAAEVVSTSSVPLDQTPYTDEFDRLYHEFITRTGVPYSKNEAWQYFLSARKRGWVRASHRRPRSRYGVDW
jgi:hypothetical protein